jgi:hypothetical protein
LAAQLSLETNGVGAPGRDVCFDVLSGRSFNGERWLAEIDALPGVLCYGDDRNEAAAKVQALALRVLAERLEHRVASAELLKTLPSRPRDALAGHQGASPTRGVDANRLGRR